MKKTPPTPSNSSVKPKIPFLAGRPLRDAVISKDDILNLVIALELHTDVAAFCEDRHLFN